MALIVLLGLPENIGNSKSMNEEGKLNNFLYGSTKTLKVLPLGSQLWTNLEVRLHFTCVSWDRYSRLIPSGMK